VKIIIGLEDPHPDSQIVAASVIYPGSSVKVDIIEMLNSGLTVMAIESNSVTIGKRLCDTEYKQIKEVMTI
jgi:hypothetical protein